MKQIPFEWDEEPPLDKHPEVKLDPAVTAAVILLMSSILIQLLRPDQEVEVELRAEDHA